MHAAETEFLTIQYLQPFLWLHFIDNIFSLWTHREEKLVQLLTDLNNVRPN